MDPRGLLRDPNVALSVAWEALVYLFGPNIAAWEPDTLRIEMGRAALPTDAGLMAKVLGAQTLVATRAWCTDHVVLFALALACDGVPPAPGLPQQPTPEQTAWLMHEISHLVGLPIDHLDDEGFDPDEIDPAVACVLLDDGWHVAPKELSFVDDVLRGMVPFSPGEITYDQIVELRDLVQRIELDQLVQMAKDAGDGDDASVQFTRLVDCRRYVDGRLLTRARQRALLGR